MASRGKKLKLGVRRKNEKGERKKGERGNKLEQISLRPARRKLIYREKNESQKNGGK